MKKKKTCRECLAFEKTSEYGDGICRRKAPNMDQHGMAMWPQVEGHEDWCCEFVHLPYDDLAAV